MRPRNNPTVYRLSRALKKCHTKLSKYLNKVHRNILECINTNINTRRQPFGFDQTPKMIL